MNQNIQLFVDDFKERMSRNYYEDLLYFKPISPTPLVNFNNVISLKKAQRYIHHTENVFQKCISKCICGLLFDLGIKAKVCMTDSGQGRGVIASLNGHSVRIHFLGQEKFVNFPRVPWMKDLRNSSPHDLYVVNIKKDDEGIRFCREANSVLLNNGIETKSFILFEEFCEKNLKNYSNELISALKKLENEFSKYQLFDLKENYNQLTKEKFIIDVKKIVSSFDYLRIMKKNNWDISIEDYQTLHENFINKNSSLLFADNDFAGSFITSEWLYKNFEKETSLEKTFIVTGYLKSIEQIMVYIVKQRASSGDTIGINSSNGIKQVDILSSDFYKATLGNLEHYLSDYDNDYLFDSDLSRVSINKINKAIKEWIKNERNGYFHKDNILSIETVNEIREKTLVLYLFLLGALL